MKITTSDTNQTFEITEEPLEHGKPYVFSENGAEWNYAEQWNDFRGEGGAHVLEMLNPKMIRKSIKP
jgi:hypothetical protein